MKIILKNLTKKFPSRNKKISDEVIAVNDFSFEIPDGMLVGLLGPSGCGKSTVLNLICGLLKPTDGRIFFGDEDVTGIPAESRGVGLVFQNYALYPHLTVQENIRFPLENLKGADKLTKEEMQKRVYEAASLVQIEELMERRPNELSGGQQQRVSIARAFVDQPKLVFADEPTGNLDTKTSLEIMNMIIGMAYEHEQTLIIVTHDAETAAYAERIVEIRDGKILSIHKNDSIYGGKKKNEEV